ncbi:MAG: MraY family glycosyltransferase [Candidatus Brocadiia bacterium]
MDEPAPDKTHSESTPRLGGPAILLASVLTLMVCQDCDGAYLMVMMGGAFVMLIGVVDDIRRISAVVKLLCLALATLGMATQGVAVSFFDALWLNYLVTLGWVVGVVSALNAIDNMDGLAGGISFMAALMFFFIGIQTGQTDLAVISIVLAGSVGGFLVFNRPPARVFLGDSGSFVLGYILAAIGVLGGWSTHPVKASLVPILILSVPLLDLAYVLLTRYFSRETKGLRDAITYRGHDHLSHRLVEAGFGEGEAVAYIIGFSTAVGVLAVAMRGSRPTEAILLAGEAVVLYLLFVGLIGKVTVGADGQAE